VALAAVVQRLDTGPLVAGAGRADHDGGQPGGAAPDRMVRLLAWSSVAQAGYILAPLAVGSAGVPAAIAYAVFFVLLEFVAFGVVVALRGPYRDGGDLTEYRGAGRRNPCWVRRSCSPCPTGRPAARPGRPVRQGHDRGRPDRHGLGLAGRRGRAERGDRPGLLRRGSAPCSYRRPVGIAVADLAPSRSCRSPGRWPPRWSPRPAVAVGLGFAPQALRRPANPGRCRSRSGVVVALMRRRAGFVPTTTPDRASAAPARPAQRTHSSPRMNPR
jgi:hypothetical protein